MTKKWEKHQQRITSLYVDEKKPLHVVKMIMEEQQNFQASTRAYRTRFNKWGLWKYNPQRRRGSTGACPGREPASSRRSASPQSTRAQTPPEAAPSTAAPPMAMTTAAASSPPAYYIIEPPLPSLQQLFATQLQQQQQTQPQPPPQPQPLLSFPGTGAWVTTTDCCGATASVRDVWAAAALLPQSPATDLWQAPAERVAWMHEADQRQLLPSYSCAHYRGLPWPCRSL